MKNRDQYVIVVGNVGDGFRFIGPFRTGFEANDYVDGWLKMEGNQPTIIRMEQPKTED